MGFKANLGAISQKFRINSRKFPSRIAILGRLNSYRNSTPCHANAATYFDLELALIRDIRMETETNKAPVAWNAASGKFRYHER